MKVELAKYFLLHIIGTLKFIKCYLFLQIRSKKHIVIRIDSYAMSLLKYFRQKDDFAEIIINRFIRAGFTGALDGIAEEVVVESVSSEDSEDSSDDYEDNYECCNEEEPGVVLVNYCIS